jgi:hypothetical protein
MPRRLRSNVILIEPGTCISLRFCTMQEISFGNLALSNSLLDASITTSSQALVPF